MLRNFVAAATTTAVLATGCAAGRPWPAQPVAVADRAFATQGRVATIDVLPLDLEIWAAPDYEVNLAELRSGAEASIMNVALDAMARRGYGVGAMIDRNGDYPGGNALAKDDLVATVSSLARYGASAADHPGELPVPFLPARLGTTTGADATLYVGGWAYVAEPQASSTGEQIAEAVVIGLVIISVVAIIAAVLGDHKSSHGSSHDHHSGGSGHASGGSGHASGGHGSSAAGGFTAQIGGHGSHGSHGGGFHHVARAAEHVVDAFGRAAIDIEASTPDWDDDPALPRSGGESQMYLEMTLVDNHTGLALWHAHQIFPASAASDSETARVARTLLSLLPARTAQLHTASN